MDPIDDENIIDYVGDFVLIVEPPCAYVKKLIWVSDGPFPILKFEDGTVINWLDHFVMDEDLYIYDCKALGILVK